MSASKPTTPQTSIANPEREAKEGATPLMNKLRQKLSVFYAWEREYPHARTTIFFVLYSFMVLVLGLLKAIILAFCVVRIYLPIVHMRAHLAEISERVTSSAAAYQRVANEDRKASVAAPTSTTDSSAASHNTASMGDEDQNGDDADVSGAHLRHNRLEADLIHRRYMENMVDAYSRIQDWVAYWQLIAISIPILWCLSYAPFYAGEALLLVFSNICINPYKLAKHRNDVQKKNKSVESINLINKLIEIQGAVLVTVNEAVSVCSRFWDQLNAPLNGSNRD